MAFSCLVFVFGFLPRPILDYGSLFLLDCRPNLDGRIRLQNLVVVGCSCGYLFSRLAVRRVFLSCIFQQIQESQQRFEVISTHVPSCLHAG